MIGADIRPLLARDVSTLVGVLGRAYGIEQHFEARLHSYLRMGRVATFVAELDGVPVGMVVGNDYGRSAYVSQMAVDPAVQRRGIGTQLMDGLIDWADARGFAAIELDATPAGAPLYARYGFRAQERTDVYGDGATRAAAEVCTRPFSGPDRAGILAADARAFGADRSDVLALLIDAAPQHVLVAGAPDRIDGYVIAQPRPQLLGPLVAPDAASAAALIEAARRFLPAAHRICVPSANHTMAALISQRGYRLVRSLAHMVRGTAPAAQRSCLFARINLGQG